MSEKTITQPPVQPRTSLGNIFNPRTIRARLVRLLILLVLLPSLAFVMTTVILGLRSGQQQVTNQLDAVATYKQQEIDQWVTNQRLEMALELASNTLGVRVYTMQNSPPGSLAYQAAYLAQLIKLNETITLKSRFYEFSILDTTGQVVLSTDSKQEKKDYSNEKFFQEGMKSVFISAPVSDQSQGSSLIFSHPIVYSGKTIGVLTGRANLQYLSEIMSARAGLGQTGETYLVDFNNAAITPLLHPELNNRSVVQTEATIKAFQNKTSGSGSYNSYHGQGVIGVYKWLPDLQMALVAEQTQSEAFTPTYTTLAVNVGVMLIALLVAVLMAILFARNIGNPITHLANAAEQIASGDLTVRASIERLDEIGFLATTFNSMTAQLFQTLESLEQRVVDRTTELEKKTVDLQDVSGRMKKRAEQLQAVAQVGRAVTSIQSLDELLPNITKITSEQLGYYHVGIFLLDKEKEYAILSATNSEGGKRMLERSHKLQVGSVGIVGHVASVGRPRIALDTGTDAVFFTNPDLPDTHSEMALPLSVGFEIIGVLDVQSEQPAAFGQEDIELLTILADQVSIAIQNARRFQETQEAIKESEATIRQYLRKEWKGTIDDAQSPGYRFSDKGINPLDTVVVNPNMLQATQSGQTSVAQEKSERQMAVPIKLRGQVIGVMHLQSASNRPWEKDIMDITQAVADRVALAVENARLLESSQYQAARERTVGEITSKIGASVNLRNVLQTAVEELGRILPGSDVVIQIESKK